MIMPCCGKRLGMHTHIAKKKNVVVEKTPPEPLTVGHGHLDGGGIAAAEVEDARCEAMWEQIDRGQGPGCNCKTVLCTT